MSPTEHRVHARLYLAKAEEYLASAEDNLLAERATPAAGDAIHAGISAKDAITTALTGRTTKNRNHALAARELRQALGHRREAPAAERAFAELIAAKAEVEYGIKLVSAAKAEGLVRRARSLVSLAAGVVQLGQ